MDNKYLVELSEIEAREIIGNRWISAPRAMKYLPAAFILLTLIMAISLSFVCLVLISICNTWCSFVFKQYKRVSKVYRH